MPHLLGIWSLHSNRRPEFDPYPSPNMLVDTDVEVDEKVVAYLRQGHECRIDVICDSCLLCKENVLIGNRTLTDGTYAWHEGFAHYVEEHGILFPVEFRQHLRSVNYALPNRLLSSSKDAGSFKFDHVMWIRFAEPFITSYLEVQSRHLKASRVKGRKRYSEDWSRDRHHLFVRPESGEIEITAKDMQEFMEGDRGSEFMRVLDSDYLFLDQLIHVVENPPGPKDLEGPEQIARWKASLPH